MIEYGRNETFGGFIAFLDVVSGAGLKGVTSPSLPRATASSLSEGVSHQVVSG